MTVALHREPTAAEVQVEQTLIALLMDGADMAWFVLDRIDPLDLFEPLHQRIVEAVRRILDGSGVPTPLTVAAALATDQGLNLLGGAAYLKTIHNRFGRNTAIAAEICDAVVDQAQRRALAAEIAETEQRLRDMATPAADLLAEHQTAIEALIEGRPSADEPISLYDAAASVLEAIDAPDEMRTPLVPYGIAGLDDSIGGMAPGDLIIAGGRPGMGKTCFGLGIADHVARSGKGVLFVSLEMKEDQLSQRWLSMDAYSRGVKAPYSLIRLGKVNDGQRDAFADSIAAISQMPLKIDRRRGQTVSQIAVRARSMQAKMKRAGITLALVVIDHLHLIEGERRYHSNKVAEMTEITKALKILAGRIAAPILCLAQLNRASEARDDKQPQMSDLRESGSIEQDADVVLLLHRPEYYAQKNKPDASDIEALAQWETKLERAKGHIYVKAAKVRQGAEDEIKAECQIAYNWIGGRMT